VPHSRQNWLDLLDVRFYGDSILDDVAALHWTGYYEITVTGGRPGAQYVDQLLG